MKNSTLKKILPLLVIAILIIPTVTHAAWWNPLTWFRKAVPVVQIQQAKPVTPTAPVSIPAKEIVKKASSLDKGNIKNAVPQVVPVPVAISTSVVPPVTAPVVTLTISNVSVVPSVTSAQISWTTNLTSESKLILNGVDYPSQEGVGTYHSVIINNLTGGLTYQGNITATANGGWATDNVSIVTRPPKQYSQIQLIASNDSLHSDGNPFSVNISGTPGEQVNVTTSFLGVSSASTALTLDSSGNVSYQGTAPSFEGSTRCDEMVDVGQYDECVIDLGINVKYKNSPLSASKTIRLFTGAQYNHGVNPNGSGGGAGTAHA